MSDNFKSITETVNIHGLFTLMNLCCSMLHVGKKGGFSKKLYIYLAFNDDDIINDSL